MYGAAPSNEEPLVLAAGSTSAQLDEAAVHSPRERWHKAMQILRSRQLTVPLAVAVRKGASPPTFFIGCAPPLMHRETARFPCRSCALYLTWPALLAAKEMLCANPLYWLLVFIPLTLLADGLVWPIGLVFSLACVAILPLAALLGDATEQVAIHTSEVFSGLLNATFGNATELIVAYFALQHGLLTVVQVSS